MIDGLTPRERQVCQLVAEGKTCREISGILGCGIRTVEAHVYNAARHVPGEGHPMKRIIRAWAVEER